MILSIVTIAKVYFLRPALTHVPRYTTIIDVPKNEVFGNYWHVVYVAQIILCYYIMFGTDKIASSIGYQFIHLHVFTAIWTLAEAFGMYYIASGALFFIFLLLISIAHYCYTRDLIVYSLNGLFLVIVGLYAFPRSVLTAIADTYARGGGSGHSGPPDLMWPLIWYLADAGMLGIVYVAIQSDFYSLLGMGYVGWVLSASSISVPNFMAMLWA